MQLGADGVPSDCQRRRKHAPKACRGERAAPPPPVRVHTPRRRHCRSMPPIRGESQSAVDVSRERIWLIGGPTECTANHESLLDITGSTGPIVWQTLFMETCLAPGQTPAAGATGEQSGLLTRNRADGDASKSSRINLQLSRRSPSRRCAAVGGVAPIEPALAPLRKAMNQTSTRRSQQQRVWLSVLNGLPPSRVTAAGAKHLEASAPQEIEAAVIQQRQPSSITRRHNPAPTRRQPVTLGLSANISRRPRIAGLCWSTFEQVGQRTRSLQPESKAPITRRRRAA